MGALSAVGNVGDAGVSNDDASYDGSAGLNSSLVSADYYRAKINEFQATMNALDVGYRAAVSALQAGALDQDNAEALQSLVWEYEARRGTLRTTAEAINMGAAAVNYAGGRMPELSIPGTLGLPFVLPFAAIAAVGAAAALVSWGNTWLRGVNDRLKTAQLLDAQATPEGRAALAVSVAQSDAALRIAENSGVGAIAPLLKWGAIALAAFLAYRALAPHLKG